MIIWEFSCMDQGLNLLKTCAENVYLEFYEDIYGSHVSLKHVVLEILSLGCSFPSYHRGWSSLDMGCSWLTPLRWTFRYLDGAPQAPGLPIRGTGSGQRVGVGCLKGRQKRGEWGCPLFPEQLNLCLFYI